MKTTNFVDAQKMHRQYPDTFEAPTDEDLNAIEPGMDVKVCHNDERFWVKVTGIRGDVVTGTVDNHLVFPHPFKCDDKISFSKKNIYSILEKDNGR